MTEWKEYKFSDFIDINPLVRIPKNIPISFVEMKDLDPSMRYCESSQLKLLSGGSRFINGDTLFARITPCLENGKICQVRNLQNNVGFGSTEFHVLRGKEGVSDTNFVYYLSRWNEVRDHAEHNMEGSSGRQRVPKEAFDTLYLPLPPLPEQIRIASILSSLDDKIDLLHRENKTLEAMAETLFRQWFIEEAKEDWEEGKLGDFVSVIDNRGKTPPYTDNITEYPIIEVNALTGEDRYVKYNLVKKYVEKDIYDFWFRGYFHKYDIFVSTVGSIGELAMCLEEKGVIAQNVIALHANNISPFYLYQYLNYNKDDLKGLDIGSVQPSIKVPHLLNMSIIIPPHDKLKEYDIIMLDIIEKEEKNIKQIQTLIQQRDGLLPKLMSGEVKI